jgi:hypothetical protein
MANTMNPLAVKSLNLLRRPVTLAIVLGLFATHFATAAVTGTNKADARDTMKQKNSADNVAGVIEGDVEMEGVAIINDRVFIDGESIPKGKTRHVGKKSGLKYRIHWGTGDNLTVTQE